MGVGGIWALGGAEAVMELGELRNSNSAAFRARERGWLRRGKSHEIPVASSVLLLHRRLLPRPKVSPLPCSSSLPLPATPPLLISPPLPVAPPSLLFFLSPPLFLPVPRKMPIMPRHDYSHLGARRRVTA